MRRAIIYFMLHMAYIYGLEDPDCDESHLVIKQEYCDPNTSTISMHTSYSINLTVSLNEGCDVESDLQVGNNNTFYIECEDHNNCEEIPKIARQIFILECDSEVLTLKTEKVVEKNDEEDKKKMERDITKMEEYKKKMEKDINRMEEDKKKMEKDINKMEEDKNKMEKYINKMKEDKKKMEKDINKTEEDNKKMEKDINKLEEDKEKMEDDINKMEEYKKKMEKDINKMEEDKKKMEKDINEMEEDKKKIEKDINKMDEDKNNTKEHKMNGKEEKEDLAVPILAGTLAAALGTVGAGFMIYKLKTLFQSGTYLFPA